jgi:hypothetical protein
MPKPQKIALIGQSHLFEFSSQPFVSAKMTNKTSENVVPDAGSLLSYQPGRRYNTHIGALPNSAPEAAESYTVLSIIPSSPIFPS